MDGSGGATSSNDAKAVEYPEIKRKLTAMFVVFDFVVILQYSPVVHNDGH